MTSEELRKNPLFLRNQFRGDPVFEMPILSRQDINLDDVKLIGYDQIKPGDSKNKNHIVHFFLDDHKFEGVWRDPESKIAKLKQYQAVLTPQFSTFYTMPVPLQIYNTFRSKWCGAFWQFKGLTVIPTVSWGLPQSYWYCFDGIPKGSVVAVSTLGVKKEKDFFMQGYQEMLKRLEPKAVLCYSDPFPEMKGKIIPISYASTNHLDGYKKSWTSTETVTDMCYNETNRSQYHVTKYGGYLITTGFGSGGGSKNQWKPKSEAAKRFLGKPGEIKHGDGKATKIGNDGRAEKERHYSDHGFPDKHSNPHDHDISWDDGHPDFSDPINYPGDPPEFKNYQKKKGEIEMKRVKGYFETEEEFAENLYWEEPNFEYQGKSYWITVAGKHDERLVYEAWNEESAQMFLSPKDAMNYMIDGKRLGDLTKELIFIV